MTFRRKTCPHCRKKLEAGHVIHDECIDAWTVERKAKEARAEAKRQRMAAKVERAETRKRKEAVKSPAMLRKEVERVFNEFIRLRDADLPCISCGRHHQGQWHAGHYLSVGAHPELRFSERNVHKQCAPCNNYLSGNIVKYRIGLVNRIGLEAVEWLEGPHPRAKWTEDELRAIRDEYKEKVKELKA